MGLDCVSGIDFEGRTVFVVDAHRDPGKRFVVRADAPCAVKYAIPDFAHGLIDDGFSTC